VTVAEPQAPAANVDPPQWLQNAAYPAQVDRGLIDALWQSAGILLGTDLAVTAGAGMSVDVAAGRCVVSGTDQAGQGKYLCTATGTNNLAVGVAPGAGTSRIDLVVARVYDDAVTGGGTHLWTPEIVAGTAAAAPVAPATPPSSIVLAQLTIPSGLAAIAPGNIADRRTPAVGMGGPKPHLEARRLNVTSNANAQGVINHVRPFTAPPILLVWSAAQGGGQAAYIFTPMAGDTASSFTVFVWNAAGAGANAPNVTVSLFVVAMEAQS
jgi:hypothetical protein